jgi:hypothetical protein
MSEYVVHFPKDEPVGSAYGSMLSILSSGRLVPGGRFGAARSLGAPNPPQESVCFSEIPLDRLDRLVGRRSRYGIGFHQERLLRQGGGRVWYVDRDTPLYGAVQAVMAPLIDPPFDRDADFWRLTPFIDFPGEYGGTQYRFEWEREWRVPGEFRFAPGEVEFLFVPEHLQAQARHFFATAQEQNLGPAHFCPLLDPLWSDDEIQAALATI